MLFVAFVSVEEMIQMKATDSTFIWQHLFSAFHKVKFGNLILVTKMFSSCSLGGLFSSRSVL